MVLQMQQSQTRALARRWLPPAMQDILRRCSRHGWRGDYPSWQAAAKACTGYQDPNIAERVEQAVRRVLAGRAACERDGVVFSEVEPRWPVLALLLRAAAVDGRLSVVDVGGSLGSTWLQHRAAWSGIPGMQWTVVEQPEFVRRGQALFPQGPLTFRASLDQAWEAQPNVVLLSAVLHYLPEPHRVLADIIARKPDWIIIDRTPTWRQGRDRITVQRVPPRIYPASYPSWVFSRTRLEAAWAGQYGIEQVFDGLDRSGLAGVDFLGWGLRRVFGVQG